MRYWFLLLAFGIVQSLYSQEFRGGVSADFSILPKIEGEIELEMRGGWVPESYFTRMAQFQVDYVFSKRWSAGLLYSYSSITESGEHALDEANENKEKNRFAINVNYQTKRLDNDFRIGNRLRYQYASVHDKSPKQYIRNKVTVDYRMTKAMNPYISVEPYISISDHEVHTIRVYLGTEMPVFKSKIDVYYISEITHKDEDYLNMQYMIGLTLKLDFRKE